DPLRLRRVVIDQPASDLAPFGIETQDEVAAREFALDTLHADRQEALALVAEHRDGAGVEVHTPANLQVPRDPALARRHHALRGLEQRADGIAAPNLLQHAVDAAVRDHRRRARARRPARSKELGAHAAAPELALALAGHGLELRVGELRLRNQLRAGILARVR